jgi:uncharacterized membrane protein (UPF0127 family)
MTLLQVVNADRGTALGSRIALASRWGQRLRGLLGRPGPGPGEGVLLAPCRSVHMIGMRYPIDVAFLDRDGRAVALYPGLRPGFRTAGHRRARYALELRAGALAASATAIGDRLVWQEDGARTGSRPGSHLETVT